MPLSHLLPSVFDESFEPRALALAIPLFVEDTAVRFAQMPFITGTACIRQAVCPDHLAQVTMRSQHVCDRGGELNGFYAVITFSFMGLKNIAVGMVVVGTAFLDTADGSTIRINVQRSVDNRTHHIVHGLLGVYRLQPGFTRVDP